MGGVETMGTQVRRALPDAHQGYLVVTAGASSSRSGGSGGSNGVRSYREDEREKGVRGKGKKLMIPQSGTNHNVMVEIASGLKIGEEGA